MQIIQVLIITGGRTRLLGGGDITITTDAKPAYTTYVRDMHPSQGTKNLIAVLR